MNQQNQVEQTYVYARQHKDYDYSWLLPIQLPWVSLNIDKNDIVD